MDILSIDQNALASVNGFLVGRSGVLDGIVQFCAVYLVYGLPVLLLLMWFLAKNKRLAVFLSFFATVFSWFILTKLAFSHLWFRARPDLALIQAKELAFSRPDYSFPSDHATALFALVFGLYAFDWKKAANWILPFAIIIVVCRVAVGVHFPLDIIGGAASGAIGVGIVWLVRKPIEKCIYNPVVKALKKVKLA